MTLDKRHIATLWSVIIIAIWTGLIFLFAYPSRNAPTDFFGVVIYWMLTVYFGLATGALGLIFRVVKIIKSRSNFFYNFVGTLNVCLGILGLVSAIFNQIDRPWVLLFLVCFIIGFLIYLDIYLKKKSQGDKE